jgi:hypothetical protein
VLPVNIEELSQYFIDYDTDKGTYELPKRGKYLMLIFLKEHESYVTDLNLFTTLRRFTLEKLTFYSSNTGKVFQIIA